MQNCQLSIFQRILFLQHTSHISHILFQRTLPNTLSHPFNDHSEIPTYFLNLCENFQHKTYFPTHFSNIHFTKEEEVLSHLFPFSFYLLIPATFCCTHSPILRRKCSSIFIPLIVNCLMKSYAFSSFALSVRFSTFSS